MAGSSANGTVCNKQLGDGQMSYLLFTLGVLTAFAGFVMGFGSIPLSAPQQVVQHLDFAIGMLGLLLAGIGAIVYSIDQIPKAITEAANSEAKPTAETAVFEG